MHRLEGREEGDQDVPGEYFRMLTRRQGSHPRRVWWTCDELINIWLLS